MPEPLSYSSSPSPHRAVVAATIGNALEFYDFVTYAFFAIQIGRAFFPSTSPYGSLMLSLATFGAGFVTRPIGGLVIGAYADRVGRRAAMTLSFTMMGAAIVAMALIPPYARIGMAAPVLAVTARMVMGFSLGGEVGPTTAYLLEVAPVARRGLTVAWQGGSQMIATAAGGAVGVVLSAVLRPAAVDAYGWRVAFLLGAVTLPFGLWVRRGMPETLHAVDDAVPSPVPLAPTVPGAASRLGAARGHWRVVVLGIAILAHGTIRTYVTLHMPTFAQDTLHMAATPAFAVVVVSSVTGLVGVLYGGWLSDRVGRRPVMVWFNLATLLLTYPVFLWVVEARSRTALLTGMGLLGVVGGIPSGGFYVALAESLPKAIRGRTFATIYAVAIATFGGTCQLVVNWLVHVTGNPMAMTWYLLAATVVGQVAMQLFPESAPARLAIGSASRDRSVAEAA